MPLDMSGWQSRKEEMLAKIDEVERLLLKDGWGQGGWFKEGRWCLGAAILHMYGVKGPEWCLTRLEPYRPGMDIPILGPIYLAIEQVTVRDFHYLTKFNDDAFVNFDTIERVLKQTRENVREGHLEPSKTLEDEIPLELEILEEEQAERRKERKTGMLVALLALAAVLLGPATTMF